MTNTLVGDVYAKIIEEVVAASTADFEESGVGTNTLNELQQEWQAKLSARGVATMPWDPKPQPQHTQPPPSSVPSATANGLPPQYQQFDSSNGTNGQRIKQEGSDPQYHGLPNGYPPSATNSQGGLARAQQLVQEQYGNAAQASLATMQQRGGLALPNQNTKPPQGLQLPAGNASQTFQQQQAAAMMRQQQAALSQQQSQPRIKVENDSPQLQQGSFQQRQPNYSQTDGADEALDEWRAQLAQRRAAAAEHAQQLDRMMYDQIMHASDTLQSGLMLPLSEHTRKSKKRRAVASREPTAVASSSITPSIPQFDGEGDDDDDKALVKDADDENAINSDLDDSDDDGAGVMGDDDDDLGDSILCTYDKVQRVKNKWKCTLKDGVMSVKGKEWVFHKGMGEFEW